MGYTHRWSVKPGTSQDKIYAGYMNALPMLKNTVELHRGILANGAGDVSSSPTCTEDELCFNGIEEDSAETFYLSPKSISDFCKTYRNEYDLPVCECLLILYACIPGFVLNSDGFSGYRNDLNIDCFWEQAIENVEQRYGIKISKQAESQGPGREMYIEWSLTIENMTIDFVDLHI